jgi:hypothetical protein
MSSFTTTHLALFREKHEHVNYEWHQADHMTRRACDLADLMGRLEDAIRYLKTRQQRKV